MAKERLSADARTAQIVKAGYELARKHGIKKVTRAAIARDLNVSVTLVNRYFGDREGLRADVLQAAADAKDAKTLAAAMDHYEIGGLTLSGALLREIAKLRH
jgi:AcrR family transcriptional regulator